MSASVLRYRKLVTTDLANQAVNLAESGTMGHRVQIPMSVDDLNEFFVWDRPAGTDRAVGHFVAVSPSGLKFDDMMVNALSKVYTDIDGVTNGLNFSSAILDANADSRVRLNGTVSANDIVMSYLLYKCYGSSSAPTMSVVYNLEDAQKMLSNGVLTLAIHNSLSSEEALSNAPGVDKGSVDAMFRDLLATDPMRFFDATGNQIPGLFETNVDVDSTGPWAFVENDKIEMRVQFNFTNAVTRRGVQDTTQGLSGPAATENVDSVVIPAGSNFIIRLQIVATDTPSGAASKAAAAATAISSALSAQAAAAAKAAQNAAAAQRAATQAVSAAAAQTAAANARYQQSVRNNAAQATAVSNAQAAAEAAEAALAQAIATGSTQSDIQNQRAAAVAAAAAVTNAQAIAQVAAADLQAAQNAQAAAAASLAAAQTAAAQAASNVASANAAAAAAALAVTNAAADAAAAAKTAADAASDPLTQALTAAEKKILDPQTVVSFQAQMNTMTNGRVAAQNTYAAAQGAADLATQKSFAAMQALSDAIAAGQTLAGIQVLRAAAVSAAAAAVKASAAADVAAVAVSSAANAELAAQQAVATASSQACVLRQSIANADVNAKERLRATVATANDVAQAAYSTAQTTAATAQAALDSAIASGAVATEVQTKRQAVISANAAVTTTKAAADNAAAAVAAAVAAKALAVTAAANADEARLADIAASAQSAALVNSALVASTNYQNAKLYLANANQRAKAFNTAQMAMNDAKQSADAAAAAYVVARDALDTAVAAGGSVPQIVSLRVEAQAAADAQTRTQRAYNTAVTAFNLAQAQLRKGVSLDASGNPQVDASGNLVLDENTIWDASANALLIQAAQDNLASITNAEANSLVLAYISAEAASSEAQSAANDANNTSMLAQKALENGITGGLTLTQIAALRATAVTSASTAAAAVAAANAAKSGALNALGKVFTPGPTYAAAITILNSMRIVQDQANNSARTNAMAAALNAAYAKDTDAQKALVVAQYAQYVAEKALNATVIGGGSSASIKGLRDQALACAQLTASARQTADFTAAALAQQVTWAGLNFTIDSAGAQVAAAYTTDASGVAVLTASLAAATASAEQARCNALVLTYMDLLKNSDAAQTAAYNAQAVVDTENAALSTAITQGRDLATLQALRATLAVATNALASAQAAETAAKAASAAALDALLARDPSGNYLNAAAKAVLDAAVVAQTSAIDRATANTQVNAYVAAFASYQQALSAWQTAQSASLLAAKALDTAITAGSDVNTIQGLRTALEQARANEASSMTARDNANTAQNALMIAIQNGTRDASGVMLASAQIAKNLLVQAQLAQQAAISGAESNARARIYYRAMNDQAAANVALANAQAAYDAAAAALDQAITAGASIADIQTLRAASQAAGNTVANAQATASAAANAVTVAKEAVNADPNAVAILADEQRYQANKVSLAKANVLIAAWSAAQKAEAAAQRDLDLAKLAQSIAAQALDTAIANGASIADIQSLRNTSVAAAATAANAQVALTTAAAATLGAQQAAAADPVATSITSASVQFKKIADASAAVNSAVLALTAATATAAVAKTKSDADAAASTAANNALTWATLPYDPSGNGITSSPFGGKTPQEIVDLRAAATAAATVAAASKLASNEAAVNVVTKAALKTVADAALAAIPPTPLPLAYAMTTVTLNEKKVSSTDASGNAGNFIYIDSTVLQNAKTGLTIGSVTYDPVDLSGVQILGVGLSTATTILSYKITPSMPSGLYSNAIELSVSSPVDVGNGIFYLVGGEVLLKDFMM